MYSIEKLQHDLDKPVCKEQGSFLSHTAAHATYTPHTVDVCVSTHRDPACRDNGKNNMFKSVVKILTARSHRDGREMVGFFIFDRQKLMVHFSHILSIIM